MACPPVCFERTLTLVCNEPPISVNVGVQEELPKVRAHFQTKLRKDQRKCYNIRTCNVRVNARW